jgi:hypothetical protein
VNKIFAILAFSAVVIVPERSHSAIDNEAAPAPTHIRADFQFELQAPMERAAKLFGPEGERCWAGQQWNPEFIYPRPAKDTAGAVFTIRHGPHQSLWVNTVFNLPAGRFQYVSFTPDVMVTTVDVKLEAKDPQTSYVTVTYTHTALSSAFNEQVKALATKHSTSGPDWRQAIQSCLNGQSH